MLVSGKSGFVAARGNFVTGPTSDHSSGGLVACPLNRLKVVIPIFGLISTSLMGAGRTITVSRCAKERQLRNTHRARDRRSFIGLPIGPATQQKKITKMTTQLAFCRESRNGATGCVHWARRYNSSAGHVGSAKFYSNNL